MKVTTTLVREGYTPVDIRTPLTFDERVALSQKLGYVAIAEIEREDARAWQGEKVTEDATLLVTHWKEGTE